MPDFRYRHFDNALLILPYSQASIKRDHRLPSSRVAQTAGGNARQPNETADTRHPEQARKHFPFRAMPKLHISTEGWKISSLPTAPAGSGARCSGPNTNFHPLEAGNSLTLSSEDDPMNFGRALNSKPKRCSFVRRSTFKAEAGRKHKPNYFKFF